ncbi:6-phospho-beta-glucosidase [Humibacter ginsengiterrae]|jgi:6-phospho-beta-glucosidase
MKLAILGGGGFRTPFVYQALLGDIGPRRVTEVALLDSDRSKLDGIRRILDELAQGQTAQGRTDAPRVVTTTHEREAIEDADFVFAAIRVGGIAGRRHDEHVALDLGVLGQETTGPGGLSYALRTIPVMRHYAEVIREHAPGAYLLNFTNPAGIITESLQPILGDRVLGICDTPSGLIRRAATLLGLEFDRLQPDYIGLNHLGWMRRLLYDGVDVLPALLADDERLAALEEGEVFGTQWIRALRTIPNEYLYYYYFNRDAVRNVLSSGLTRGDFLAQTQDEFFHGLATEAGSAVERWRAAVARRDASYMAEAKGGTQDAPARAPLSDLDPVMQGYAGVALEVMHAISRNERSTMILNVRNRGAIPGMPDDAVVEVPSLVDAGGTHPLVTAAPDAHQLGLMLQLKDVERHIIRAATTGDRNEALLAFALHPLVDSVTTAERLLDGYIAAIPEVAAVFRG